MQDLKMGGTEGFGIGLEVEQRLRGEEGMERHIFGHSRETGEKSKTYFQIFSLIKLYSTTITAHKSENEKPPRWKYLDLSFLFARVLQRFCKLSSQYLAQY